MPHADAIQEALALQSGIIYQAEKWLKEAGRACTSRFIRMEGRNDAADPPPEVALAASRGLASRAKIFLVVAGLVFLRERRRATP